MSATVGGIEESSLRYRGWRIVLACFLVELFIFGFGLYGHGVYLSELQRLHGWPTALISSASTLSLLLGNLLVAFTNDALRWMGPRRLLLTGMALLAASTTLLALVAEPWQLVIAFVLMAFGWTLMGTVGVATIVGAWFQHRRGLAISLAFNGATCGGIILAPALVFLVGAFGFSAAMLMATAAMIVVLVPVIVGLIGMPAEAAIQPGTPNASMAEAARPASSRWALLRDLGFWTITLPSALALTAQIAFIVHQIAILETAMARSLAGVAVSVTTAMAVAGRIGLGLFVDRIDPRMATTVCLVTQAAALFVIMQTAQPPLLFAACAVFGLSIGNLITLPPLIIQREFAPAAFGTVLGLSTAIGGTASACGPALIGFLRDATGGYLLPLGLCICLQLAAAVLVLWRPRPAS